MQIGRLITKVEKTVVLLLTRAELINALKVAHPQLESSANVKMVSAGSGASTEVDLSDYELKITWASIDISAPEPVNDNDYGPAGAQA